ncbi:substrate-binding periplasmic protein [Saccharobesus litoralis]|uniref:substrate-binding periplasmic protein n=1 Tax=Saccharobesus litoralis TaxID=2172099 RepID=UPI00131F3696|nr:transporter substrate-binding domain-containing protein [Saccharobesus litoralis]
MAQEPLKLIFPHFPPYTYQYSGQSQGIGIELVSQALDKAGLPYEITATTDYGRALYSVKAQRADGFFLASQNNERDRFAVFSQPLVVNRWCWFLLKNADLKPNDAEFKSQAKIGTYLNTNTHKWLLKNQYKVAASPSSIDSLLLMLNKKRIHAILLAEVVFENAALAQGVDLTNYLKIVEVEKPFGLYISKQYLSRHPDVMQSINDAILQVSPLYQQAHANSFDID